MVVVQEMEVDGILEIKKMEKESLTVVKKYFFLIEVQVLMKI